MDNTVCPRRLDLVYMARRVKLPTAKIPYSTQTQNILQILNFVEN